MNDPTPTLLQIDVQNLFYGSKFKGCRLDFEKVWEYFHNRETEFMTDALAYTIQGDDYNSSKFESRLREIGFTLKTRKSFKVVDKSSIGADGNPKVHWGGTNHDVTIAVDCMSRLGTFNKWILMSGDGDFIELAKHLKQRGKIVEIWSFNRNPGLETYANKIYQIDEKFFLREPNISVFGINWGGVK